MRSTAHWTNIVLTKAKDSRSTAIVSRSTFSLVFIPGTAVSAVMLYFPLSRVSILLLSCLLLEVSVASALNSSVSKRGIGYDDGHISDNRLLASPKSSISWYYTWSANPSATLGYTVPFVPLVAGLSDVSGGNLSTILSSLPPNSTYLLTFNEPDGTSDSGGSAIAPSDAAKAYIDYVVPLRAGSAAGRSWKTSHPSVTGSGRGLAWLQEFNASCYALDPVNGCAYDFVALHYYGALEDMISWIQTLRDFYEPVLSATSNATGVEYWVTEFSLPQASAQDSLAMLNQSLLYLDSLPYVTRYSWFGDFRQGGNFSSFTGDNVAFFDANGGLTDVGALYLGGASNGFVTGMNGGPDEIPGGTSSGGDGNGAAPPMSSNSYQTVTGFLATTMAFNWLLLMW